MPIKRCDIEYDKKEWYDKLYSFLKKQKIKPYDTNFDSEIGIEMNGVYPASLEWGAEWNEDRCMFSKKIFNINVWGDGYYDTMWKLAEKIETEFGVTVNVTLKSNELKKCRIYTSFDIT